MFTQFHNDSKKLKDKQDGDKKKRRGGLLVGVNADENPDDFFGDVPDHFYYYHKDLGDEQVKKIIEKDSKNHKLESLNLACTNIGDDVIDTIIEHLIQKHQRIKELNLSGNHFTEAGISRLLDAIESNKECKITKLFIGGNNPTMSAELLERAKLPEKVKKESSANNDSAAKKLKK